MRRFLPPGMSLAEHLYSMRYYYLAMPEQPKVPPLASIFTGFHDLPLTREDAMQVAESFLRQCGQATETFVMKLGWLAYRVPGFDGFRPKRCKYWLLNTSFRARTWSGMFSILIHCKTGEVRWAGFSCVGETRPISFQPLSKELEIVRQIKVSDHPYRS